MDRFICSQSFCSSITAFIAEQQRYDPSLVLVSLTLMPQAQVKPG